MKTNLRKVRLFFAAQDQKEAEWLREMGKMGWRFEGYSFLVYTFSRVEPEDMVYQIDLFFDPKEDRGEYLQLFEEFGWELAGEFAGWHYFRQPYRPGVEQRIYTDKSSLIAKYQKYLTFSFVASGPSIYFALIWPVYYTSDSGLMSLPWYSAMRILLLILAALSMFNLTRLLLLIRRLKNENPA
ncbi:MAG: DUF2812 domain-containing protein [Anaerolineales bacterium]|nr:DUF2812 domain-containing protein [Anaerolineales bacterium]